MTGHPISVMISSIEPPGGSIGKAFVYLGTQPLYYLYNVLIVLTSLVFSELFKHRKKVVVKV